MSADSVVGVSPGVPAKLLARRSWGLLDLYDVPKLSIAAAACAVQNMGIRSALTTGGSIANVHANVLPERDAAPAVRSDAGCCRDSENAVRRPRFIRGVGDGTT